MHVQRPSNKRGERPSIYIYRLAREIVKAGKRDHLGLLERERERERESNAKYNVVEITTSSDQPHPSHSH